MSSFLHAPLLWGLLAVGIPVLIHLIHVFRQRRIEWAAMEFLLQSQKKTRKWILLRQLLLLLSRMAAIAAIVLLFAQPVVRSDWADLLGGGAVHHLVLLDDSYSMSDAWAGSTAYRRGQEAISRLAERLATVGGTQNFTLLRFSECAKLAEGTQPPIYQELVGAGFGQRLQPEMDRVPVSELSIAPEAALSSLLKLFEDRGDETLIVYLVSDFRARDWENSPSLKARLNQWHDQGARFQLVRCADRARPNVSVAGLAPAQGIRAAGAPMKMEVQVINHGQEPLRNVPVFLEEDGRPRASVVVEEIAPGETESRTFPVRFTAAGDHHITARVAEDAVAADNRRFAVLDLPEEVKVLIIDPEPALEDSFFLSTVMSPGGTSPTGLRPSVEPPRYLQSANLDQFGALFVLNLRRLEESERAALENYVRKGGGAVFFLSAECDANYFNADLYREGQGAFPAPLERPRDLLVDRALPAPDIQFSAHPAFRIFEGNRNPLAASVRVDQYYSLPPGWLPDDKSRTQVIARFRNGAPAILEKSFGEGKSIAVLTTAGPRWNNWARNNPTFVVAMLELNAYLAQSGDRPRALTAGQPLTFRLDPLAYKPQLQVARLADQAGEATSLLAQLTPEGLVSEWTDTRTSGFARASLSRTDGQLEASDYAINVDPAEGNLAMLDSGELASRMEGLRFRIADADDFRFNDAELAGFNLTPALFFALLAILVCEQILAYLASYHRSSRGGTT